jgi:hypothetical protein
MKEARQSTLYNETGNMALYRVSEETRRKGLRNFLTYLENDGNIWFFFFLQLLLIQRKLPTI